jgi:hypothetical protein
MHPRVFVASVIFVLALVLMLPAWASTEVVGHISQVEGQVDLLKGGRLPATRLKLQDKVESGDLIRTKSRSQARITFMDNSTLTIFSQSRLAIEEYRSDAAGGNRRAVVQLFQGQVQAFQVEQPDFVIKTRTALVRFRGTELGCVIHPNFSTIMNFAGRASVINISPNVGEEVNLDDMQSTTVGWAQTPSAPVDITALDRRQFMNQTAMGSTDQKGDTQAGGLGAADLVGPGGSTMARDLGLNISNPVMPGANVLTNPALLGRQGQPSAAPQQATSAPVGQPTSAPVSGAFMMQQAVGPASVKK